MPAFMKYQGVDGTPGSQRDYIEVMSYSHGSSQSGTDVPKGAWVLDSTPAPSAGNDGTSNTVMFAEMVRSDGDYLLTSTQHAGRPPSTAPGFDDDLFRFDHASGGADASGGEDSRGLWQINAQPVDALGEPVTFTATITVAHGEIATVTIAHEGFLLI